MKEVTVKLRPPKRPLPVILIPPQALPEEDSIDVVVVDIKNPWNFYVQLGKTIIMRLKFKNLNLLPATVLLHISCNLNLFQVPSLTNSVA